MLSRIRRMLFITALVAVLVPVSLQAQPTPCPDQDCRDCAAGFCWLPVYEDCEEYVGCNSHGGCTYNEGGYTLCYCFDCN
jgi:hypothetical protein